MTRSIIHLTLMALVIATSAHARTLEVGENKEFKMPSAAAAIAQDGDHVEIQPGEYFDCAVWSANKLVVEGIGDPDKVIVTDKTCQGKALFVTVGEGITIRNLTLTRARVPDGNGAGIRGEGKNLVVDRVHFVNNQNGILSGTVGGSMIVRNSVFDRNGACDSACAHGLYVGNLDLLQVEQTRFIGTKRGHHIKSRALRTEVDRLHDPGWSGRNRELRNRNPERRFCDGARQHDRKGPQGGEPLGGHCDRRRGRDASDAGDHRGE